MTVAVKPSVYCAQRVLKHFLLKEDGATHIYENQMEWVLSSCLFDQQHLLWRLISLEQEVPTLYRSQASMGMEDRMCDGDKEQREEGSTC